MRRRILHELSLRLVGIARSSCEWRFFSGAFNTYSAECVDGTVGLLHPTSGFYTYCPYCGRLIVMVQVEGERVSSR